MRFTYLALAWFAIPLVASAADDTPGKKERKALAGKWKVVAAFQGGQELPEGKVPRITFEIRADGTVTAQLSEVERQYTLTLDPSKKPKAMDIVLGDGGDKQYAIYKLEDGKLKIAATPPGGNEGDRPRDFNDGRMMVCERVKGEQKP